mgnify:CR=1 FL=1
MCQHDVILMVRMHVVFFFKSWLTSFASLNRYRREEGAFHMKRVGKGRRGTMCNTGSLRSFSRVIADGEENQLEMSRKLLPALL